jgi:regulatory protein
MSSFRPRRPADDEPPAAPKPGTITDIQPQRRDNARVSVYIDGAFAFGLHIDLQLEHYLKKGDVLDEEQIRLLLKQDAVKKAISTSLSLIAYRPRSAGELASKLRERSYDAETIDVAIGRMRELNYLDDREFADRWVESRQMHRPRSTRMLRQELQQKGVDQQIIDSIIEEARIDEFGDALALGQKKAESLRALEPQVRDRRLSGFLARRGYSYDVIRRVLEALETEETVDGQ